MSVSFGSSVVVCMLLLQVRDKKRQRLGLISLISLEGNFTDFAHQSLFTGGALLHM